MVKQVIFFKADESFWNDKPASYDFGKELFKPTPILQPTGTFNDFLKWANYPKRKRLDEEDLQATEEARTYTRSLPARTREIDWD